MWPFKKSLIPKNPGAVRASRDIEYDPRKAMLSALPVATQPKPEEFFGLYSVPHIAAYEHYQYSLGCCVAESGSRYAGILSLKENGTYVKPSVQGLMAYIKSRIEKDNGYGATIESCPKALKKYGDPLETEYPSNYKLTWDEFIDDKTIPSNIEESGTRQRINTHAWTDDTLDSINTGIYIGEGNIVHGGAVGSSLGWKEGSVRPPISGEKLWGHAIDFFGYDNDWTYFTNSWSWAWGLTLYLKKIKNNFGEYYIKGTPEDYSIIIKGVGRMSRDYEQGDYLFSGLTYIDLPDDVAAQTKMLKTVQAKADNRVYEVIKDTDGKDSFIWITSERAYDSGILNNQWLGWDKIIKDYVVDPTRVVGTYNKES